MSRLAHNEPFDADVLTAYLKAKGCRFLRQTGSHLHFRTVDGQLVGSAIHGPVTTSLMRKNAAAFGMTYSDLRADMGWPIASSGKTRFKPAQKAKRSLITGGMVVNQLNELDALSQEVRRLLAGTSRDESVYDRAYRDVKRAISLMQQVEHVASGRPPATYEKDSA